MAVLSVEKFLLLFFCVAEIEGKAFVRLCYFTSWAYGRESPYSRFDVEHVDPSLCSHLVYAFAVIDQDSHRVVPMDPLDDSGIGRQGRYQKFNNLKRRNNNLKTLLSVGGQLAGSESFMSVTRNDGILERFAQTTVQFLRQRNFDGLDIDWEYPNATTKESFTKLLKALRTAFEADHSRGERLLLTAALPAGKQNIEPGYDIGAITKYLDLANLMTYDYNGGWSTLTGFDSPLFSRKPYTEFNIELSTNWTVNYYINMGLDRSKIVVGVTAAGTRYKLQNSTVTGVGAPVIKSSTPRESDIWKLPDHFTYPEICRELQSSHAHRVFDEEQQVPYLYKGDLWLGYEDVESVHRKVDWVLENGLRGMMFWALDMDDFTGQMCDDGKYPLLKALSRSVDLVEAVELTKNVNRNIRYLTMYVGAGCGLRGGNLGLGLGLFLAVIAVVLR